MEKGKVGIRSEAPARIHENRPSSREEGEWKLHDGAFYSASAVPHVPDMTRLSADT